MPKGFLAVSSLPSPSLPLSEYHAWYEEEHIPIRLNHLRSFLSGARYQAIDLEQLNADSQESLKPSWLAMYEIDSTQTFGDASYTSLREKRSEREKNVMSRLDVLVRRTGELVGVWGDPEGERSTGLKVERPSGWLVTHGVDVNVKEQPDKKTDELVSRWAARVGENLQKENSAWVRIWVVKILEGGKTRMGKAIGLDEDERAEYFIVHEFLDEEAARSDTFQATLHSEVLAEEKGTVHVGDGRVWKLHKAYPCLAQGNVQV
ncbi:hypothetical protein CPB84DRAFT_1788379 [Gymnopilus junonius]|uniref:Uncharacterized protein n=1 Tax=Gymnopilus junonius TaxID=109634 RepID=A0A9P5NHD9_GYMJU|nr:hypothetical protein CPB84DRAFT_1788379 [Gymnopilus junonius]